MSKIGELTLGVGVETVFNLQFVPEFIIVTDIEGGEVSDMSWNVGGKELVNVAGLTFVEAYAEFKQNVLASQSALGNVFTTGDGYLANQQFQLRFTNNNAAAQKVYAFSRKRGTGRVITASQVVIIDGANQRFANFMSLAFADTDVSRVDLTFKNAKTGVSFSDSYDIKEIEALLSLDNPTLDGTYGTLLCIDNTNLVNRTGSYVESAIIYAAGANVTVMNSGLAKI